MGMFHFSGKSKVKFSLILVALLLTAPLVGCGGCSGVQQELDDDDDDDDDDDRKKKRKSSSSKSSSSKKKK